MQIRLKLYYTTAHLSTLFGYFSRRQQKFPLFSQTNTLLTRQKNGTEYLFLQMFHHRCRLCGSGLFRSIKFFAVENGTLWRCLFWTWRIVGFGGKIWSAPSEKKHRGVSIIWLVKAGLCKSTLRQGLHHNRQRTKIPRQMRWNTNRTNRNKLRSENEIIHLSKVPHQKVWCVGKEKINSFAWKNVLR